MNGTPPRTSSNSNSVNGVQRKPLTLKKRQPTIPTIHVVDKSTSSNSYGNGREPSPLRKEVTAKNSKERDREGRRKPSLIRRLIRYEIPRKVREETA